MVLAFFICWAPFHAQRLLYVVFYEYGYHFTSEGVYQQINEKLFYITGCFYYFSSTVNPILYNVMSVKYRYESVGIDINLYASRKRPPETATCGERMWI